MLLRATLLIAAGVIALSSPLPANAQDDDKALVTMAKTTALENLKKANVVKPTVVETDNFLIVGSLPEDKLKALGTVLEKTLVLTRKTLKYDAKEKAWKGKLTVYYLPDNAEFKAVMRRAFQVSPEGMQANLRADPPYLVDPADAPGKPSESDLYANTAARVAGEHLKAKGTGAQAVPDWLRDGFGRVTVMRAEGTGSKRYLAYKGQVKSAIAGKGGRAATLADVWSDAKTPTSETLSTSFAEYFAYGPGASKFPMFLEGLKPTETVDSPTVQQALDAAGWKEKDLPALEIAWRRWVVK